MGGGTRSGGTRLLVVLVGLLVSAGCATADAETTPVPTFAAPSATGAGAPGEADRDGAIPTECGDMLSAADLGALLGRPLDSVTVRTTIGVAEPSVGRTERVACRYSGTGSSRGVLLDLNVARYTDAAAATKQWTTNTGVEDGDRRDLSIGAAPAALFDRARESVLMVTYDDDTLTFVLPEGPRPGDRPRGEVLVDLALRVLPVVGPPRTAAPAEPVPGEDPAVAAG
ncbi:hypothetical protein H6H00_25800 [Pseudonocardia petroleophila]|uniref:DUF3558 domain-containing protein n=1 Tax=Pseudonocardia petroleophila TaxID=37331 RepID=A0A7G7MFD8_9PSEU|nr:hypothetical protein [Pseudonocardia petroleophila]QNG51499.1 hypothetical protein H6H00_25800 [Pseudonocardia petroleophila]